MDYEKLTRQELIELLEEKDQRIKELEHRRAQINLASQSLLADKTSSFRVANDVRSEELDLTAIKRYSRQLILPEFGPKGQKLLCATSVLIVGCGGLGCPAAIYLGAAGIGKLGLLDFDDVEICNLHRQILHTENRVGVSKALSVAKSVQDLNSRVICEPYITTATSKNILDIIVNYDIVLDCTDNVATRYLLNDACILSYKPLVSGSALRFEGQLTVYGYEDGPCYRCLFPKPPPPETVVNCSDGGVLGAVPGVIGCLQALEAIKLATGIGDICFKKMIIFNALNMSFQNIKLRNKQPSCEICSSDPKLKSLIDYEQYCGASATDKEQDIELLDPKKRITVQKYKDLTDQNIPHILIDVRLPVELEICQLPNSINIPLKKLENDTAMHLSLIEQHIKDKNAQQIICICRRGNDSQKAVIALESSLSDLMLPVYDIVGGLTEWANHIDKNFPVY